VEAIASYSFGHFVFSLLLSLVCAYFIIRYKFVLFKSSILYRNNLYLMASNSLVAFTLRFNIGGWKMKINIFNVHMQNNASFAPQIRCCLVQILPYTCPETD